MSSPKDVLLLTQRKNRKPPTCNIHIVNKFQREIHTFHLNPRTKYSKNKLNQTKASNDDLMFIATVLERYHYRRP